MNIDKDKWLQVSSARIATGINRFPSDGDALKADDGRHIALVRMAGRRKETDKGDDR